jgi:hypothetical protein
VIRNDEGQMTLDRELDYSSAELEEEGRHGSRNAARAALIRGYTAPAMRNDRQQGRPCRWCDSEEL